MSSNFVRFSIDDSVRFLVQLPDDAAQLRRVEAAVGGGAGQHHRQQQQQGRQQVQAGGELGHSRARPITAKLVG